jgi:hypothetical protein
VYHERSLPAHHNHHWRHHGLQAPALSPRAVAALALGAAGAEVAVAAVLAICFTLSAGARAVKPVDLAFSTAAQVPFICSASAQLLALQQSFAAQRGAIAQAGYDLLKAHRYLNEVAMPIHVPAPSASPPRLQAAHSCTANVRCNACCRSPGALTRTRHNSANQQCAGGESLHGSTRGMTRSRSSPGGKAKKTSAIAASPCSKATSSSPSLPEPGYSSCPTIC